MCEGWEDWYSNVPTPSELTSEISTSDVKKEKKLSKVNRDIEKINKSVQKLFKKLKNN